MNECDGFTFKECCATPGMGWRVALSVLSGTVFLAFLVIWLFFFAGDYSVWENIGIVFLSLILLAMFNAAIWIPYGLQSSSHEGRSWRTVAMTAIGMACLGFILIWLLFFATDYNVYQNIAVFIVVMIIGGGLSTIVSMKH